MRRKISFPLLAIMLTAMLFLAACGSDSAQDTGSTDSTSTPQGTAAASETGDSQLKPYEVVIAFNGPKQKDLDLVAEKMSEITKAKFNATVKLLEIEDAAWDQQSILLLAGNEQVDLITTGEDQYNREVAQGQLLPLDDLIAKYGKGITEAFAPFPEDLSAAKIGGKTYAIPSIRDFAAYPTVLASTALLEKYNIDLSGIKSFDDLDPVFAKIKENEPQITSVIGGGSGGSSIGYSIIVPSIDNLGDSNGVLVNPDELKVEDLYETPFYEDLVKRMRRWYLAGYIVKDAATSQQGGRDYIKAGVGFSLAAKGKPGIAVQSGGGIGVPLTDIPMGPALTSTTAVTNIMFSIPRNSKDPERAMMVLNLLYSDKDFVNLIDWGIEGKHYVKNPDGTVQFPDGVTADNSGFNLRQGWKFGNQLLSYPWVTDGPDIWKKMAEFNSSAKKSAALGFTFDPTPVKTEIAAITNAKKQYEDALQFGTIDPDVNLPKLIAAVKAAGMDKVVQEKQRQLDEWAKNNK